MADLGSLSEAMVDAILDEGFELEEIEMLADLRGIFDPKVEGSYTESVFKTADGEYFKCGEGQTGSPYESRMGLLRRAGARIFDITQEEAEAWLASDDMSIYPVH